MLSSISFLMNSTSPPDVIISFDAPVHIASVNLFYRRVYDTLSRNFISLNSQ